MKRKALKMSLILVLILLSSEVIKSNEISKNLPQTIKSALKLRGKISEEEIKRQEECNKTPKIRYKRIIKEKIVTRPIKIHYTVFREGDFFCNNFGGLQYVDVNSLNENYSFVCVDGRKGK